MVVHADIGGVYFDLQGELHRCLSKPSSNNFQNCLTKQYLCLESSIFRCLMFHKPRTSPGHVTRPLCRVINTGNQLMAHTWHIAVPSNFSLYLNFLHFNLPMTPNCKLGSKVTVMTINTYSNQKIHTYCGYRVPWYLSFLQSNATVKFHTEPMTHEGFTFVMTFQAFEIALPSVVLTHLTEIEIKIKNFKEFPYTRNGLVRRYRNSTFSYLSMGHESSFIESEVRIHITVLVFQKIILQLIRFHT